MNYFHLLTFILLEFVICAFGNENKRLLLNDPDVLSARFANLEQQNLLLNQKYMDLVSKMAQMEARIQHQDQIITTNQASSEQQPSIKEIMIGNTSTGISYQLGDICYVCRQEVFNDNVPWIHIYSMGKNPCEGTHTELVYSGYAAGQPYSHITYTTRYGGPANTLCLPKDPELSNISFTGSWSYLFGAEYEVNGFAKDSADNDVPCAVCRNSNASSSITIPGRHSCYTGWIEEYNGRLASGHEGEAASSYICVDKNPEYISSGEKNENGHLFYLVGLKCGPLPCPPYHDNHQVNCVVCSK